MDVTNRFRLDLANNCSPIIRYESPMSDSQEPSAAKSPTEQFKEMANAKLEANAQPPVERSLWKGGYSPRAMYGSWLITLAITIATIALIAVFGKDIPNIWYIAGAVLLLIWMGVIATYVFRRLGQHYELTTQRFIHQNGVLVRKTDRIEVIDIEDVSYTQGIVQRMLGVGTITISGRDQSHPTLNLCGIDNVPEVASLIDDVRRDERRKRSLHTR
jgi:membrane protein YdbS with pleckstrin-like domain